MKLSGWIFMIISWTVIIGMAIFCFTKILKKNTGEKEEK